MRKLSHCPQAETARGSTPASALLLREVALGRFALQHVPAVLFRHLVSVFGRLLGHIVGTFVPHLECVGPFSG